MIYPGFNSKKWVPIFKAKQQPDLAGSFQAKIHCFFLMVSEVFISQIHEIYPSHRWIHMGLWVVGQKISVGSQQWCASNDPVATGESREHVFWESTPFFRAARGCQICLKPMLTCSDIACLATTGNSEQNMWQFSSEIKHQSTQTTSCYSMPNRNRASRNLMVWRKPHLGVPTPSNSHRVPKNCFSMTPCRVTLGRNGMAMYGSRLWYNFTIFHNISPTKLSVFPAQAS